MREMARARRRRSSSAPPRRAPVVVRRPSSRVRSPSRARRSSFRPLHVRVPVPEDFPRTVRLLPLSPDVRPDRRRRIRLRRRRLRMRRVTVMVPRQRPRPGRAGIGPSAWYAVPGMVSISSSRRATRSAQYESNRRRYSERKTRRHRWHVGQMESLGHDRYGIVGAAVQRGLSPMRIADAAMVARSVRF